MTHTISSREGLSQPLQPSSDLIFAQQQSDEVHNYTGEISTQSTAQPTFCKLKITHVTQGRLRIRVTDSTHNSILDNISRQLRQDDGVTEVTTNWRTNSLVVTFDENMLPLPQMLARLQEFGIHQHQADSNLQQHVDPFAAWKSIDFWKEQGISFIPLFTGLGVTGALGISGLAAIPVYMITADATRRVIDYIEPQLSGSKTNKKLNTVSTTQSANLTKVEPKTAIKPENLAKSKDVGVQTTANIAYNIAHAIPGRIRLSIPKLAQDRDYARRLERLLKADPQVTNVRVNCNAASVAIAYQPSNIQVSHWVGVMQLAEQTAPQVIPIKTTEQVQEDAGTRGRGDVEMQIQSTTAIVKPIPEITGLWTNFKAPALSYSLAFMANFPINAAPD